MANKKYRIGVDIGGTNIKVALVDAEGNILYSHSESTGTEMGYDYTIEKIKEIIHSCFKEQQLGKNDVNGIGIGIPGLVDPESGTIKYLPNMPGWIDVPLEDIIKAEFGLPVGIDNDVNCAALGEYNYGAGHGAKSLICITIGTGVGAGIILDGKIYRGASGSAGEIGHIILKDTGGDICGCGNTGCLECLASGPAIVKMAKQYIMGGKATKFKEMAANTEITPKIIAEAAKQGDDVAMRIYKTTGYWIGIALSSVINLLNPDKIVIGGGVAQAEDLLFDSIKQTVKERSLKISSDAVEILPAKLGEKAGVMGASLLCG